MIFTQVGQRTIVIIFSTSLINVNIWKSVKILSLIITNIASLTSWTILSHNLPICGKEGGLKNHWIFWWAILLSTLLWSNFNISISSSLTGPLKFVPQSKTTSDGRPNRLMKLSVSNDSTNSICTARTDIQTKMQPHLFFLDIFRLTYISPKNSTPDLKSGRLHCSTLIEGKVLMKASFGLAFLR